MDLSLFPPHGEGLVIMWGFSFIKHGWWLSLDIESLPKKHCFEDGVQWNKVGMDLSGIWGYSLLKDRSEIRIGNPWGFLGARGLVIRKIEVFGVSKLCLAEKYLNCKMDFLLYQDVVCSYNLEILNWDVEKTVVAMISRSHSSLGSGRWHNPGNTASPHPSAQFPLVTLVVTSACTNL